MCGRATLTTHEDEIARMFGLDPAATPPLEARYNIAPTQPIAAVRSAARGSVRGAAQGAVRGRSLTLLRWGLVPYWAKDPRIGVQCINARRETLATKSHFKEPFRARRCLVVADGFYEWQQQNKTKRPHHIHLPSKEPFAFAGIWDRWVSNDGEVIESCAIVTRAAEGRVRELHDRMPVIVAASDYDAWVDESTPTSVLEAILAKPPPALETTPVSTYVNKADNEGPECVRPEGGTLLSLF